jgi:hypothetical protein
MLGLMEISTGLMESSLDHKRDDVDMTNLDFHEAGAKMT